VYDFNSTEYTCFYEINNTNRANENDTATHTNNAKLNFSG